MKNSLLALALFAFVGSAAAHSNSDNDGKKAKKATCSAEAKAHCSGEKGALGATPSCCMKKGTKTASTTVPASKSL